MNKEFTDKHTDTVPYNLIRNFLLTNFYYKMIRPTESMFKTETLQLIHELEKHGYIIKENT